MEPLARGTAKISSFEFQYLHALPPPLVILNELSLTLVYVHLLIKAHSKLRGTFSKGGAYWKAQR